MLSALAVTFMTLYRVWHNSLINQKLFEFINIIFVFTITLQIDKLGAASPTIAMCINIALVSGLFLSVNKPRLYLAILSLPIWLSTTPLLVVIGWYFDNIYLFIIGGSLGVGGFLATIIVLTGIKVSFT
jgi:hypothetical protein